MLWLPFHNKEPEHGSPQAQKYAARTLEQGQARAPVRTCGFREKVCVSIPLAAEAQLG